METAVQLKKKICLLGVFAVGKTSLVERFVYNRFDEKYLTTLGVKVSQKILPPVDDTRTGQSRQHIFLIWDIAAMEKFDAVVKNYYRGAAGALVVADLTREETIGQLSPICEKFLAVNPAAQLLFIGNKTDLLLPESSTQKRLGETAATWNSDYLFTSAKTGQNVEAAFRKLSQQMEDRT